jgi:hypothetical protein
MAFRASLYESVRKVYACNDLFINQIYNNSALSYDCTLFCICFSRVGMSMLILSEIFLVFPKIFLYLYNKFNIYNYLYGNR